MSYENEKVGNGMKKIATADIAANLERRRFIKASAMAAATAMATGSSSYALPVIDNSKVDADGKVQWDKAPCRFCGTGCHVQVGVQSGKVVAIAGDKNRMLDYTFTSDGQALCSFA